MTRNARIIVDIIKYSDCHPTAEEIFFEMKKIAPKTVLATVYNNLKILVESGEIRKLTLENSPDRYDKPIKHDHLICCKCGKITDISFKDYTKELKKIVGDDMISYDLKVNYICPDCKNKK